MLLKHILPGGTGPSECTCFQDWTTSGYRSKPTVTTHILSHPLALSRHFEHAAKIQPLEPWFGNMIARVFVNKKLKTHLIWNLETTGKCSLK